MRSSSCSSRSFGSFSSAACSSGSAFAYSLLRIYAVASAYRFASRRRLRHRRFQLGNRLRRVTTLQQQLTQAFPGARVVGELTIDFDRFRRAGSPFRRAAPNSQQIPALFEIRGGFVQLARARQSLSQPSLRRFRFWVQFDGGSEVRDRTIRCSRLEQRFGRMSRQDGIPLVSAWRPLPRTEPPRLPACFEAERFPRFSCASYNPGFSSRTFR